MSPPHVPGIPGVQLPETPEQKRLAALERRVTELEQQMSGAREKLDSINEFEEDSKVTIPSDAPKLAKAGLGALSGLTPTGRAWVLGVLGLAAIIAGVILLALRVWHI